MKTKEVVGYAPFDIMKGDRIIMDIGTGEITRACPHKHLRVTRATDVRDAECADCGATISGGGADVIDMLLSDYYKRQFGTNPA